MERILRFLTSLFQTDGFLPRDLCRTSWPSWLVALHNGSDLAIWGAYLAIPMVLFYFVRKREKLPFRNMLWLFGLFILSCGFTHFLDYYTTEIPMYRLSGFVKLVTAIASWATVIALIPLTPKIMTFRLPEELELEVQQRTTDLEAQSAMLREANEKLAEEVEENNRVHVLLMERQAEVEELNQELEARVSLRTSMLEASNRELESFAYSVSHDLRAPLRAIDGFGSALAHDYSHVLDDEGKRMLERVRLAAKKMDGLISSLLSLSRLTRAEVKVQDIDFSEMVMQVAEELRAENPEREVAIEIAPDLRASADPDLLRVVMVNLLSNAWKFTYGVAQGRIQVGHSDGAYYVRDNGVGYNPSYASKLFAPFERLHSESAYPGTGIGLATCQRIVQKHGGKIWAEGSEGHGATFYFTLT